MCCFGTLWDLFKRQLRILLSYKRVRYKLNACAGTSSCIVTGCQPTDGQWCVERTTIVFAAWGHALNLPPALNHSVGCLKNFSKHFAVTEDCEQQQLCQAVAAG
jgi:hypothetical protein